MIRQRRLTAVEDDLELVAVVAEAALHNPIGGRDVLREQLDHLLMASDLENVTLQVLPTSVGAHSALASGFTVLNFGELREPDIAYVEHTLGAVTMDKTPDVERARVCFDRLRAEAAGLADSLALLRRALDQAG
jgi:hypothetical protein